MNNIPLGFPRGTSGKEPTCQCKRRNTDSTSGSGRSPGEGNGYPLQYSCLGNLMDRGAWWATVHRVIKSQTQLSDLAPNIPLSVYSTFCLSIHPINGHLVSSVAAAAKSLQLCPTLCDPINGSLPGSPVPGILQARTLEWVAISFSDAWKWSPSVMSDSSRPHGLQPTRLLCPREFPGKSTGLLLPFGNCE